MRSRLKQWKIVTGSIMVVLEIAQLWEPKVIALTT